jgi:type III restriction enzyme
MMAKTTIDRLIINTPYEEPARHWRYERETRNFDLVEGRRPAGYVVASGESKAFDDPGIFVEIPLVNQIRPRVNAWCEVGYPGVSSITKRLLEHWRDPEEFEARRFFFCQLEAVETLIWLTEAPAAERVGIEIPGDGGAFIRQCCKMATGSGKTIVMAMAIAWHILNKVTYPQDARFAKNVLVMAPGLTVRNRLAVLGPAASGKKSSEEALFGWIVSDFGLNDAIESGLVKTPRVVVRDDAVPDAKTYKSRLYHIYNDPDVKDDLNRKAQPEEPLPDLVLNAYYLLGYDWCQAWTAWNEAHLPTPPVMITVCNRTETAARVKHAFDSRRIHIDELCDPERILHIDSKVLKEAEEREEPIAPLETAEADDETDEDAAPKERKLTKAEQAELLRRTVDTVGKAGQPGEKIQNVISVGMLSEGWDAKTVTHIMGLRAFTSQLLCEQVVGRGLQRTSYEVNPETGLFEPEYVNIFGVPFAFLPHEGGEDGPPPPPKPKTAVEPDPAKEEFEIRWPNVVRIDRVFQPTLTLDWSKVRPLELHAAQTAQVAELAPILEGKPDVTKINRIELERLAREFRTQHIIFETARDVFDQMKHTWRGSREVLLAQLVGIVEEFIRSDKLAISPPLFYQDELRRRLIITLNMSRVVQHVWEAVRQDNTERLTPVFDRDHPIRSTGEMRTWYTGKPCERTRHSHINVCVYDSAWEASDAFVLDDSNHVAAWAKNDHLGFEVLYVYRGIVRKYRPDFLVRLTNGEMLVLETKGQDTEQDKVKRRYLDEWTQAVNAQGGFGHCWWAVASEPGEIRDILIRNKAEGSAG